MSKNSLKTVDQDYEDLNMAIEPVGVDPAKGLDENSFEMEQKRKKKSLFEPKLITTIND